MFKSVRHGENVLQYTILPQDEEGAISGGAPGARGRGPGGARRRSSERRARRKSVSTWIIVAILVCIAVTGAVVVPVLLSVGPGGAHPSKKFQTFALAASSLKEHAGRYNIHGTQFIVVPVEQVEGPQGLLEELDSQLSHEEHHQAAVAPATPATQPPATRTTRLNATHPSSSSPTPAPVDPGGH
nr:PREDICTED: uncharacterized protein LOC109044336 isoform X1 [Bemisia tabaci]XP_018917567.1 PREDICTED: uncharacterized protein LOC109044336 isoform X1 [Bemisia tabaci]XP_018917568.1 PREDICTED: uncharacterized protein LOC109044336 isoform X1 [Bemisia tabaci]